MYIDDSVVDHWKLRFALIARACFSVQKVLHCSFPLPAARSCYLYWEAVSEYVGLPRGTEDKNLYCVKKKIKIKDFLCRVKSEESAGTNQKHGFLQDKTADLNLDLCLNISLLVQFYVLGLVHHRHYG